MRVPDIYSPIDAKVVGRTRLYAIQGIYTGCDNNGVVLIGTGDWTGKCLIKIFQNLIFQSFFTN